MAKPVTASAYATITNPSSALTDFTLIVDLSLLPAATKIDWNSNDGGRGRAYKQGTETELACDFIDCDFVTGTGQLRVKWTGTLASSGTQQVQIFLPNTGNTLYAVTDTYGQYNAYDSSIVFYSPNGADNDRTSNQNTVTYTGTPTINSENGLIGKATHYQTGAYGSVTGVDSKLNHYMSAISKGSGTPYLWGDFGRSALLRPYNGTFRYYYNTASYLDGTYTQTEYSVFQARVSSDGTSFRAGANGAYTDFTGTIDSGTGVTYNIGRSGDVYVQHVFKTNVDPGNDYLAQEESQLSDNTTFWGTWTNVPVGVPASPDDIVLSAIILESTTANKTATPSDLVLSEIVLENTTALVVAVPQDLILSEIILENTGGQVVVKALPTNLVLSSIILEETTGQKIGAASPLNLQLSTIILQQTRRSGDSAKPACVTINMSLATTAIDMKTAEITINMEVC